MVDFNAIMAGRTNKDLLLIIGAWAKATLPDLYAETLKQVSKPAAFRNYLLRLIEIRSDGSAKLGIPRDSVFLSTLPVWLIDETSIKRTLIIKSTGEKFIIAGRKYMPEDGEPTPSMTWTMLDAAPEDFAALTAAIKALDLEVAR